MDNAPRIYRIAAKYRRVGPSLVFGFFLLFTVAFSAGIYRNVAGITDPSAQWEAIWQRGLIALVMTVLVTALVVAGRARIAEQQEALSAEVHPDHIDVRHATGTQSLHWNEIKSADVTLGRSGIPIRLTLSPNTSSLPTLAFEKYEDLSSLISDVRAYTPPETTWKTEGRSPLIWIAWTFAAVLIAVLLYLAFAGASEHTREALRYLGWAAFSAQGLYLIIARPMSRTNPSLRRTELNYGISLVAIVAMTAGIHILGR